MDVVFLLCNFRSAAENQAYDRFPCYWLTKTYM